KFAADWQDRMDPMKWMPKPCAVCGRRTVRRALSEENPLDYDLTLLRNPCLPIKTLPTTYDLDVFKGAILCPAALRHVDRLSGMDMCTTCKDPLKAGKQPLDALANFQYYGREELPQPVKQAFAESSMFDIMMIARCRATRITHMFSSKPDVPRPMRNPATSQRYSTGNVAIFAQDVASVRSVLPPPQSENIRKLSPVVVSKSRVETLINFLLNDNAFYAASGATFSRESLDQLLGPEWEGCDSGVPCGVELCCLPVSNTSPTESYADRGNHADHPSTVVGDPAELVMDAVGYTVGERSPEDYRKMKASAVAWCPDKKSFMQMQTANGRYPSQQVSVYAPGLDP
ncbi:hypothetical protein DFH09DRAFT_831291, partial [Mycena vulgaris]